MQHWTWKWCPNSPNLWSVCPNICQKMWALFEREIFIQTWMLCAACTHMWGNREYWSAAGSAGFGNLSFFKISGKNMKLEWCRVDIFEGQGEGVSFGRKESYHFLWNTICSESNKPIRDWAHINWSLLVYFSFDRRMKVFAPSELHDHVSTHNNILGVTLSGDFCDVCTLSDLRPNHSWATPHKISLCLARPPLPKKLIPFLPIFPFFEFPHKSWRLCDHVDVSLCKQTWIIWSALGIWAGRS